MALASANVCTFYESTSRAKLSSVNFSARRSLVFEQFRSAKISCFGLQESRANETRIYHVGNYLVVTSKCDKFRNYGLETCIDTKSKINACSATMEAVTLICAEPTILLISVQFGSWLVYFLNFHAPHCEAKAARGDLKKMTVAQRKAWWKRLSDICANLEPKFPLFVFCDANATMGSVVSQHVSSHGAAPNNVNSVFFANFLQP